ncbi:MAG: DUF2207 domain-containing protein, partial [Candidatus Eisenbacteria bacterium]|nr:DUF2207 domain-containing protein [Candidatus Eisenbacteria bacterium]
MNRTMKSLALLLVVFALASVAEAKSYYVHDVDIDVNVRPDGGFEFREVRTFDFDGDFTFAYYQVEKVRTAGGSRVEITDFAVGEEGRPFDMRPAHEIDRDRTPGTYWVDYDHEGRFVYAKWFYRAEDERRGFDISYYVHDAVVVYDDFAQLYWKFVGEQWDVPTRRVTGTIHLPPGADKDNVRAWLHANLTSEVRIEDGRTVTFEVDNLQPGRFVELRILFPPELVPAATERASGEIWDRAYSEEKKWVEEANARRAAAQRSLEARRATRRTAGWVALALALGAVLTWWVLFYRFGREHRVSFAGDYYRELPSERPPAVVGYLYNSGAVTASDMVATIMDLARRGYLRIREEKHEDRSFLEKMGGLPEYDYVIDLVNTDFSDLRRHESDLLHFLFSSQSARGDSLSLFEFKKEAQKRSRRFHSWFTKWKKKVVKEAERENILEKRSSRMTIVCAVVGGVVAGLGLLIVISTQALLGLVPLLIGVLVIALAQLIKRRSPEAGEEFRKWRALRKYLLHFSNLEEAPPMSITLWEHFLVYAVTLGVARQVIKQLEPMIPKLEAAAGRS